MTDGAEILTYKTTPNDPDSDNDGIGDGPELQYWGAIWNSDIDGDGLINLLDPDSDNDLIPDGQEIYGIGDPAISTY